MTDVRTKQIEDLRRNNLIVMPPDVERAVETILTSLGEDPKREGLVDTPARVARMLKEICAGYDQNLKTIVNGAIFESDGTGMVLVEDISFYSLCEHHLLPFFGRVQVAYIPDGKVIGLSKIPRIVEMFARRLQMQERLTKQILDALTTAIAPKGAIVRIEGKHLCAVMRGVKKENSRMVTMEANGVFTSDPALQSLFLKQIHPEQRSNPDHDLNDDYFAA